MLPLIQRVIRPMVVLAVVVVVNTSPSDIATVVPMLVAAETPVIDAVMIP